MKKRLIAVFLVMSFVICAALAGCGGGESENGGDTTTGAADGTEAHGGSGSYDPTEKVKLTVGLPQNANVTSYTDNAFTKYLEENANVELEFVYFPSGSDDYIRKLTLMAAAGDEMPDVLLGFSGLSVNARNEFGDDGYFIDLTDLVENYAPNYKAALEKLDQHTKERIESRLLSETGKIYAMPEMFALTVWDDLQDILFINQTWLDTLGLKAPTTPDELYEVLKAFRDKDPNGNGLADEIPLFGRTVLNNNITSWIINSYVYLNDTYELNVTDGKLWSPFVTDEYRQALIFLNKLCREGLLSDLSFSAGAAEMKAMVTPGTGVAQVGIWAGHPSVYADHTSPILKEYAPYAGLGDSTGKGGYIVIEPQQLYFPVMITADCDHPEAAMRFIDLFYLDETASRQRHGEKGVDWVEENGQLAVGGEGYIKVVNANAFFKGNSTWCANMGGIMTAQNYLAILNPNGQAAEIANTLHKRTYEEIMTKIVKPAEVCEDMIYTAEQYEQRVQYLTPLRSFALEQRNLFILGTLDPNDDTQWNNYLAELDHIGLQEYIALMQNVYDNQ
ncbi:MAG: extracellular solute-binding protein [Lachnospiraceae bacterium]|nr:extracellular solute-binding protein [Lachnospiraceae bacterium]